MSQARLPGIQMTRGLAAIAVAFFHAGLTLAQPEYGGRTALGGWFGWGDVGVDVFFVLSGFIILKAHEADIGKPSRWFHYVYRRVARIYPIYWIYLSLCLPAVLFVGTAAGLSLTDYLTGYLLVRFNGYSPPLGVAWTLYHEILFYTLFGMLVLNRHLGMAMLFCWLATILVVFDTAGGTFTGVVTSLFNLYFFLGMTCAMLLSRNWIAPKLACALAMLFFTAFIILDHFVGRAQMPYLRLLIAPASAFLLLGLSALEARKAVRYPTFLLFLGDASYSIYLLHYVICSATARLLVATGLMRWLPAGICIMLLLAVAVAASALAYLFVERPLMRRLHPRRPVSGVG